MDKDLGNFLDQLEKALDALLQGKTRNVHVDEGIDVANSKQVAKKFNKLIHDFGELFTMGAQLSEGKLDGLTPPRDNMLASPLKQLQSQLSILTWNLKELMSGKVVSKMDPTGELFLEFNELVDKVSSASTGSEFALHDSDGQSMNSWRYHQILLAINMLHILVIEVDSSGKIVYTNMPARELLGDVEYLRPSMAAGYHDELLSNLALFSSEDHDFPVPRELYNKQKDAWYKITSDTFVLPGGQRFYLHMVDDITDWKKSEKELKYSATVDALTGAYNRRPGLETLTRALNTVPSDEKHCLAFLDIDELKYINDNFGHTEGDYCIKTVASVLLSSVRFSDTVVRYGGDEFFILFKDCSMEVSTNIVVRMKEKLDKINSQEDKPYKLSFSYGIVDFKYDPARNVKNLLEEADAKMYEDKKNKPQRGRHGQDDADG